MIKNVDVSEGESVIIELPFSGYAVAVSKNGLFDEDSAAFQALKRNESKYCLMTIEQFYQMYTN